MPILDQKCHATGIFGRVKRQGLFWPYYTGFRVEGSQVTGSSRSYSRVKRQDLLWSHYTGFSAEGGQSRGQAGLSRASSVTDSFVIIIPGLISVGGGQARGQAGLTLLSIKASTAPPKALT